MSNIRVCSMLLLNRLEEADLRGFEFQPLVSPRIFFALLLLALLAV
jgi:hypothetical protein